MIQFYWCAARARRPKAAFPFAENKPPNHLPTLDRAPTPRALPLLADEEEDQEEGNTASHRQALPSLHAPDSQQGPVRRKLSAPVGDVGGEEEHCAQAGGLSAADGPRPRETSPQPTRQSCAASSETVTAAVEVGRRARHGAAFRVVGVLLIIWVFGLGLVVRFFKPPWHESGSQRTAYDVSIIRQY